MALTAAQKAKRRALDAKQRANVRRFRKRKQIIESTRRKRLRALKRRGGTNAQQRRSRNRIESRYNKARRSNLRRFVRVRRRLAYPQIKSSRNSTDIFEHYDIQRLFASDATSRSINDAVNGQIPGSGIYDPDQYVEYLDDEYSPSDPTLQFGTVDLDPSSLEWVLVQDDNGNVTYNLNITIPNSDGFTDISARYSQV